MKNPAGSQRNAVLTTEITNILIAIDRTAWQRDMV